MDEVTENKETCLLELPEEMILFILSYLEDAELYFNVRCVCQRLRYVAQNYIEIGSRFISIAGVEGKYDLQSRTVTTDSLLPIICVSTVFQRNGKFTSVFCKMQSPKQLENYLYLEDTILGANVGHSILFGIGKDVFQYNIENGKWICIQDYQDVKYERTEAKSCLVGGAVIVCGGLENPNEVEFLKFDMNAKHEEPMCLVPQKFYAEKLPVSCYFGHTVTNIDCNKVLVIGGVDELEDDNGWGNSWDGNDCLTGRSSSQVIKGIFNGESIIWTEVSSMEFKRSRHTTFQLKNNVFVFGGNETRICEKFDFFEEKWFRSHDLPPKLCCIPYSAIITRNKSKAILLCNHFWRAALLHVYGFKSVHKDQVNVNTFNDDIGFQDITLPFTVKYCCDTYKLSQYIDMKTFRHFISIEI